MIQVNIEQHGEGQLAGKWDIHVHDGQNGELLVFSNQGYENRGDAERIARRLFGSPPDEGVPGPGGSVMGVRPGKPEPVDMAVIKLDGTGGHEMIR